MKKSAIYLKTDRTAYIQNMGTAWSRNATIFPKIKLCGPKPIQKHPQINGFYGNSDRGYKTGLDKNE